MKLEPGKTKKNNNYWIVLTIVLLLGAISLILFQQESKSKKINKEFPRSNEKYDNNRRQNNPINDEDNDENENRDHSDPNQDFYQKGFLSEGDIQQLKS